MSRAAYRAVEDANRRQLGFAKAVQRGRRIAREDAAEVARVEQRQNPNRGKRHAAKLSVHREPRTTERQYAPGTEQVHRMRHVEESWTRVPSLGSRLYKRRPQES